MKKLLASVLAAAMALSLAACGSSTSSQSPSSGSQSSAVSSQASASTSETESAEKWRPDSAVTLIVPSTAGGGHDNAARLWAKCAEKYAGVPINIVNDGSGSGVVAQTNMMTAEPDGLTIGQTSISLVSDQYLVEGATYNQDSFKYIGLDSTDANYLVINADGPYADMELEEFLSYARENPGAIRIGVSGSWTNHDYTRYMIEQTAGVEFTRVSIKGGANIVLAILGGDLDAGVPYPSEIAAQVEAGALKILALTGNERSPFWPDVPTFAECGYDINLAVWRALVLPKDTPDEILEGWEDIYEQTMKDPETIKAYEDAGLTYCDLGGNEATKEYVDASHDVYKAIIDTGVVTK